MAWKYTQKLGGLFHPDGNWMTTGYAGREKGLNNPAMEQVENTGPLPRGIYKMERVEDHPRLGPLSIRLRMTEGESHGRHSFFIHGDNAAMNKTASHGCIVVNRRVREAMAAAVRNGGDCVLEVTE